MIKKKFRLICFLLVLIGLTTVYLVLINTPSEKIIEIFDENEAEYNRVAEIYYKDFQDNRTEDSVVYHFEENGEIICRSGETQEKIIEEKDIASFKVVHDSYFLDDKHIETVYVNDNFVSFCNIRGSESFVYSVDGTKPKYVNGPSNMHKRVHAVKITDNWYYVRGR